DNRRDSNPGSDSGRSWAESHRNVPGRDQPAMREHPPRESPRQERTSPQRPDSHQVAPVGSRPLPASSGYRSERQQVERSAPRATAPRDMRRDSVTAERSFRQQPDSAQRERVNGSRSPSPQELRSPRRDVDRTSSQASRRSSAPGRDVAGAPRRAAESRG